MTPGRDSLGRDPKRGGNGRFERTLDGELRDAEACRLRTRGLTYQQIADALDYGNRHNARRAIKEALDRVKVEAVDELRKFQLDELNYLTVRALKVLERKHIAVTQQGVVLHKGRPVLDDDPALKAIDRLLRIAERRAKLMGLDAPTRHEVLTIADIDAELARLLADHPELADGEAGEA